MKKFKFLCIILLVVSMVSIIMDFVSDFIIGAKMGYNVVEYTESRNLTDRSYLYIDITSDGENLYSPNAINKKTNDSIAVINNNVSIVEYAPSFDHDTKNNRWNYVLDISNWIILAIYIYLIIIFIKIMRLFIKSQVFEKRIITLLNNAGIACLILSLLSTLWNVGRNLMAERLIDIENISISYRNCVDWSSLMLGLVILVITEILRLATTIKEEQDLTI